jgi:inhibitor of cysteine peptidase
VWLRKRARAGANRNRLPNHGRYRIEWRVGDVIELSESDAGASLSLHQGDELRLRIVENPTTGYRWQFAQSGSGRLAQLEDRVEPANPGAAAAAPGAAGHRIIRFMATAAGSVRLEAVERREWEPERAGNRRLVFELVIL